MTLEELAEYLGGKEGKTSPQTEQHAQRPRVEGSQASFKEADMVQWLDCGGQGGRSRGESAPNRPLAVEHM